MDPGYLGEILNFGFVILFLCKGIWETQNELLTKASESVLQELSNLQGEEEMMMRKYYAIMSEHGKVKKKNGHGKVSADSEIGNSTALATATRKEENQ
ncbi:hypothetical protein M0R45_004652 [Rubus argutus]|uniref:Uncharacterized protein n=1 Tax=Rubus argutus TaxID=59490 RepID=A0AAW1YKC4_RUBAR